MQDGVLHLGASAPGVRVGGLGHPLTRRVGGMASPGWQAQRAPHAVPPQQHGILIISSALNPPALLYLVAVPEDVSVVESPSSHVNI